MISRRRLTFQLTPLLDLLLIVIFAQFMDTQETTARIEQRAEQQVESAEENAKQLSQDRDKIMQKLVTASEREVQSQRNAIKAEKQAMEVQKQVRAVNQILTKENREKTEQLERVRKQRDRIAELIQELFHVPDQTIDPIIKSKTDPDSESSKADLARIKKHLQELADAKAEDVVKHLLTYDELTKRSDIWELYLTENGVFRLTTGDQITEFRADSTLSFVDRFYAIYKTVPQPKSLVIILFSYGDAKASVRFAATQGLPLISERMRADSNGRTRYEYAVIGFAPEQTEAAK